MKANRIVAGLFSALVAITGLSSCDQIQDLGEPKITIEDAEITLTSDEGETSFVIVSTIDWELKGYTEAVQSWLAISPTSGKASAEPVKVSLAVTKNEGKERSAVIEFYGSKVVNATVTIKQAGSAKAGEGTLENPYSASEAFAVASALESGATTPDKVFVKGYVKKFASKHEDGMNSFGNASFYMTDDKTYEGDDFYAYQVYAPGNKKFTSLDQINVGDEVVVYGQLTNYNGTAETVGKGAAYCYSINGKTEGGVDPTPSDAVDATVAEFLAAEVDNSKYYRLTGVVGGSINTTYGNFDLTDETGTVYVYGLSNIAEVKDKLVAGAKITVVGTRGDYQGKSEVMNGTCEKIEEGETPEPPTDIINATVAEFLAAPVSDQYYRLSGTVGGSINTTYGNFDLTDETGTVYVYGLSNIAEIKDKLLNGASITIVGKRYIYSKEGAEDKDEVKDGYCESIEGGETPEPPTPGDGKYESTISWTLGANSYDNTSSGTSKQTAVINGEEVSNLLKLGKSSAAGTATLHVPAGVSALSFYAYAWKGTEATLKFTLGSASGTLALTANEGFSGNPPYTVTIDDDERYKLTFGGALPEAVDVTVTTTDVARIVLFGIKPYETEEVDYTLDMINMMECYYDEEDGSPYWMFDLYVSDEENDCWSTLDICLFADAEKDADTISGEHEIWMGSYTLNDGTEFAAEGTLSISCLTPEDADYYGTFMVIVDLDLDNGEKLQYTFPQVSGVGYNFVTGEDLWLQDKPATKAAASNARVARGTRQLRRNHTVTLR